jgi:hypothetical protein
MFGAAFRRDRTNLNIEYIRKPPRKFNGPTSLPETDEQKLGVFASLMIADRRDLEVFGTECF